VVWINARTAKVNANRRLPPRGRVCLEGRHTLERIAQNGRTHGVEITYSLHYYISVPDGTVSGSENSNKIFTHLIITDFYSFYGKSGYNERISQRFVLLLEKLCTQDHWFFVVLLHSSLNKHTVTIVTIQPNKCSEFH